MLEAQLPWIASLQGFAQFAPIYFILKLAIFMSEENVIILTTCALFWLVDRRIAVIALLLVLGSEYVNFVLKWTVHQPRPYWMTGSILALSRQPDFGFPTAYAQDALVYWTYIAYSLNKKFASRRFWLFPAIIVPLASFASVAFGANFFHDTVAGLVIGASILLCARYAASHLNSVFETRPRLVSILVFLSAPLMILLVTIRGMTIGAVKLEGTWKQFAMAGTDLPPYLTFAPWNSNAIFSIC
ncbi:MAG: phosphatase PAP2 family protein, partial [Spirochaetia bacterium]|nr:phosphatase PAP2 family protein [Spirochaetia bacterium]